MLKKKIMATDWDKTQKERHKWMKDHGGDFIVKLLSKFDKGEVSKKEFIDTISKSGYWETMKKSHYGRVFGVLDAMRTKKIKYIEGIRILKKFLEDPEQNKKQLNSEVVRFHSIGKGIASIDVRKIDITEQERKEVFSFFEKTLKTYPTMMEKIRNEFFPLKYTKDKIKKLRTTSKKLPIKPLKLKEATKSFEDMSAKEIHHVEGYRKNFDYEKGLDELIKKDKYGGWICDAGINWKEFDYEKGLNALLKIDESGNSIYQAGIFWKQFNYKKGLEALKNTENYERALKAWPKGVKDSKKEIERLRTTSKKLPIKPLKLKEATKEYKDMLAKNIYSAGIYEKDFDFKKGLDEIIKKDETGRWVYFAGADWKKFDYKKGLEALKGTEYYEHATKVWPKGVEETKKEIDKLRKTSKKLPVKPLKLKEATKNITAEEICLAGVNQKKFDFDKGFDELAKKDKDGEWIFYAGADWKKFDYKKGFNTLIKKDEDGEWISEAGTYWEQFPFEKGLNELLKKDYGAEWIYSAGINWKHFNYKKGLDALKNTIYYKHALKNWPKGAKESKAEIEKLRITSKKLPIKPLKLKEEEIKGLTDLAAKEIYYAGKDCGKFPFNKGLDELIKKDKTGYYIYYAGKDWKQFDYKKGLTELIKRDKKGRFIYWAGAEWKQFDNEKGFEALKNTDWYKVAIKDWPKGVKDSKSEIKRLRKISKKLPIKPLKLKEETKDLEDMSAEEIYQAGVFQGYFDYEKGLNELIKKDKKGVWICRAGEDWEKFNFEKALDAIIKVDKFGEFIFLAGMRWDKFNHKKAFDALIKVDKKGKWINLAGINWEEFDFKRGLDALKDFKYYHEIAIENWPKGVKETKKEIERLRKTSKKLPVKPLRLKEATKKLEDMTARHIFWAGIDWKKFDYKKGLDELIKKDKIGQWIYHAGRDWKKFDFDKGLEALKKIKNRHYYNLALQKWPKDAKESKAEIERLRKTSKKLPVKPLRLKEATKKLEDLTARDICWAGEHWKQFDYNKGLDEIIKKDKFGDTIYYAGANWKQFDYEKGLDALIKIGKTDDLIYEAGMDWKQFNYKKGLEALKDKYYRRFAIKDWPKGVKETKATIDKLRTTSKKLPVKPLKLKEFVSVYEEFTNATKIGKNYVELYRNPTKEEIKSITKYDTVRFIILPKSKTVYAFTPTANHGDAVLEFNLPRNRFDPELLPVHIITTVNRRTGMHSIINSQISEKMYKRPENKMIKNYLKGLSKIKDWKWVDKYIPGYSDWWEVRIKRTLLRHK